MEAVELDARNFAGWVDMTQNDCLEDDRRLRRVDFVKDEAVIGVTRQMRDWSL